MLQRDVSIVVKYSLLSRIGIFLLQIVFNSLLPDHQPSDVFDPPDVSSKTEVADNIVEFALSGFRRWDAIYMIHIAEHGYIYEHTLAFFPVFPFTIRLVAFTVLYPLHSLLTLRHLMMVSALLVNTTCFVLGACYLHSLAVILLEKNKQGKRIAWLCAILFCFNPASVFMSAAYSECMFALFGFALMYHIEKKEYMKATVALALACGTRSNGVVLAGYPIFGILRLTFSAKTQYAGSYIYLIRDWVKLSSCCMYGVMPFVIYQYLGFAVYCKHSTITIDDKLMKYGRQEGYHLPGDTPSEWCYYNIPFSYGFIQKHYWNVGLFTYYQWKQIPNFLLASPAIVLSLNAVYSFAKPCIQSLIGCSFRLRDWLSLNTTNMLPYSIHLAFLLLYGLANAHVQILTRMIYSSSPLLYICVAKQIYQVKSWPNMSTLAKFALIYSLSYFLIGTAVHCNFFPWT